MQGTVPGEHVLAHQPMRGHGVREDVEEAPDIPPVLSSYVRRAARVVVGASLEDELRAVVDAPVQRDDASIRQDLGDDRGCDWVVTRRLLSTMLSPWRSPRPDFCRPFVRFLIAALEGVSHGRVRFRVVNAPPTANVSRTAVSTVCATRPSQTSFDSLASAHALAVGAASRTWAGLRNWNIAPTTSGGRDKVGMLCRPHRVAAALLSAVECQTTTDSLIVMSRSNVDG